MGGIYRCRPVFHRVPMHHDWVDVKALVSLKYDGRSYRPGEWFKARPVDALTLGQAGRVSLNREYATRAVVPASSPDKPTRRAYKRRDLTAERS